MIKKEILLIPDKEDVERDQLAEEWLRRGGVVKRIGKFWIKPKISNQRISVYGYDTFCLVLAQILELKLISVKDEDIVTVKPQYLKRNIEIRLTSELNKIDFPKFIKPVIPKLFKAEIFQSRQEFELKNSELEDEQQLICSEIIQVDKEVRAFILDKEIMDLAFYEGEGKIEAPKRFIEDFLNNTGLDLPKTFVLDIGYNSQKDWFIVEFNSTWGAGLNYCQSSKILDCIQAATIQS
jgi:hypothetical protein